MTPPPASAPPPHAEPDADDMGGPSDKDADNMVAQEQQTTDDMMAQKAGAAPKPPNPIQVSAVTNMVNKLNAATSVLFPGTPTVRWSPPSSMPAMADALPADVWVRLFTVGEALNQISSMPDGAAVKPYAFDATESATRQVTMQDTTSKLDRLARDKKAVGAIHEIVKKAADMAASGEGKPAAEAPAPPSAQ